MFQCHRYKDNSKVVAWSLPKSELRLGDNWCFWRVLAPPRWNKDSQASVCVTKNCIEQQQLVQLAQISIYMSHAARCPLARVINFSFRRVALVCLGFKSVLGFLPLISHQLFSHSRVVVTCNIRWCYPCIISVHHPELCAQYKSIGNYHLGLLFPETQWDRGLGSDLDLRVTSTLGSGSEHHGTLLFGSPSPWWLWFIHCVLSIISCVCCNLSLSIYRLA